MKSNNSKGFTLVELLIVISIIGILIAIAVISFGSIVEKANKDVCLSNQRTIRTARVYSYVNTSDYGTTDVDIIEALKKIGFNESSLSQELACPTGGAYTYELNSSNVTCSIKSHNL